jgi:hypothetical protein
MNIPVTIVCFRQTPESEEMLYFCSERPIEAGDYYIDMALQPFIRVQKAISPKNGIRQRKIEASSSKAYNVPQISEGFLKQYFALDKKDRPIKTHYRIKELTDH